MQLIEIIIFSCLFNFLHEKCGLSFYIKMGSGFFDATGLAGSGGG